MQESVTSSLVHRVRDADAGNATQACVLKPASTSCKSPPAKPMKRSERHCCSRFLPMASSERHCCSRFLPMASTTLEKRSGNYTQTYWTVLLKLASRFGGHITA